MHEKVITLMAYSSLAEWLLQEINDRNMSIREFGRRAEIGQATLSSILANEGDYPSVTTLIRLAQYTHTDICSLMALIAPEETHIDADVILIAERIKRLPFDKQSIVDAAISGFLQGGNKANDTE